MTLTDWSPAYMDMGVAGSVPGNLFYARAVRKHLIGVSICVFILINLCKDRFLC